MLKVCVWCVIDGSQQRGVHAVHRRYVIFVLWRTRACGVHRLSNRFTSFQELAKVRYQFVLFKVLKTKLRLRYSANEAYNQIEIIQKKKATYVMTHNHGNK